MLPNGGGIGYGLFLLDDASRRYLLDHSKIESELGWRPKISFEDGIRRTIEWYRANEDWWRPKKDRIPDEFAWSGRR